MTLEFAGVKPRASSFTVGGRVPGKINISTHKQAEEIFQAVLRSGAGQPVHGQQD